MPYTLRNVPEVVVNTGTEEHYGWRDSGGSRIKTLKNARCRRWIVFRFFFTFTVTLKINSGWKKGVFIFQRS